MKIAAAVAEEANLPFVTAENKFEALVSLLVFFLFHSLVLHSLTLEPLFMLKLFVFLPGCT